MYQNERNGNGYDNNDNQNQTIHTTYTIQWLYRYCIRIYGMLCFRNITLIVDLCAYLLLLLSL